MRENKLSEILRGISLNEYRKFGEFIRSPYYNKNPNLIKLYDYMKRIIVNSDEPQPSSEEIWHGLYPEKSYNKQKISILISDFKNLLQEFLMSENYTKNKTAKRIELLKIFNERSMTKNFDALNTEMKKYLTGDYNRDRQYYNNSLTAEFEETNSRAIKIVYSKDPGFKNLDNKIDHFYIISKLYVFIMIHNQFKEIGSELDYKLWNKNEILSYIEKNSENIKKEHPLIYCYYLILMTFIKPKNEKYFELLKKYLNVNSEKLSPEYLKDIYIEMKNYCDDRISINRTKYTKEQFKIYELLDRKMIFMKDKYIEHLDFLNGILVGLELNKIEWVQKFFERYKNRLEPEHSAGALSMAKAQIFFHNKEYDKALKEINNINLKIFYFYLRVKVMQIKIYYEFNETDSAYYVIDSLKHYLRRNKALLGDFYKVVSRFLYYIVRIIKLGNKRNDKKQRLLLHELEKDNAVTAKFWLIEKLTEQQ